MKMSKFATIRRYLYYMAKKIQISQQDPVTDDGQSIIPVQKGSAICDTPAVQQIEQRIFVVRNKQVIMERDLAALYDVETSQLNRQVKRNIQRFPEDFMFQLTKEEVKSLKCQNGISNTRGGDRYLPYVFTEQGVSMLSGLLRSETAIQANILIMRAFVAMLRFLVANAQIFQRLDRLDRKQLENEQKFEKVFAKFEENEPRRQGIFYDGESYDAYTFVSDRIILYIRHGSVLMTVHSLRKPFEALRYISDLKS